MTLSWLSQGEADLPPDRAWLSPRERAAGMRFAKRRTDFLLGRLTAKRALARILGLADGPACLARIEVRNETRGPRRGAPRAEIDGEPAPLAISLSDRAGWAVCATHPEGVALGCDLELVEPRSDAFVADFLTAPERALVASAPEGDARALLANLVWCAKESALKVLGTGLRRDTRSVEVALPASAGDPTHPGVVWHALRVRTEEGRDLSGWWRRSGAFLLTVAADREIPVPVSLADPPPLETAVPSHGWLAAPLA